MRIVILGDSFPPYVSGVTTYCVELSKWLLKFGHEVLILTPNQNGREVIPQGLEQAKIIYLPSIPTSYTNLRVCLPFTPRILLELRKFGADIVDAQAPSFLGIDALLSSKILKIPVVSTFHTFFASKEYLQMIFKLNHVGLLEKTGWLYLRWFYNSSNRIFVSTNNMYKILVSHKIQANKIDVISLLLDIDKTKILTGSETAVLKKKYKLGKNVAVFVGRISKEKNFEYLINAWARVIKEEKDSNLLIIGGGIYENHLRKLADKAGVKDSVVMTGAIEHDTLLSSGILSACDVFVSGSTSETFGLTGIEAMAHKIPVVLVRSQGLCEIVDDSGFVCEPGDLDQFVRSILEIFHSPKLKIEMGEKARKIAEKFNGKEGTKTIIGKYQQIIKYQKIMMVKKNLIV